MEKTSENAFITGKAGTGKSTLLEHFRQTTAKNAVFLAPTGVSAFNVKGETIHSFFGFGPDITLERVRKIRGRRAELYRGIDVIVIDEVSMARADLMDCADRFMRLNGKNPQAPFGGAQAVLVGDLYQLPPVLATVEEKKIFSTHYRSEYFFDSAVFGRLNCEIVELSKVYRQKDSGFIRLLNRIRSNSVSGQDIDMMNSRLFEGAAQHDENTVFLTATNRQAAAVNESCLERLPGREHVYPARTGGEISEKHFPTAKELKLKRGAQVILLTNDALGRWVNGSVCRVENVLKRRGEEDAVRVRLPCGRMEDVLPHRWKTYKYIYNPEQRTIETRENGYFEQYPLKLAWAMTIHKSQGQTFERVIIDTGRGAFAPGQMYVALSRCTALDGIALRRKIRRADLMVDERVVRFLAGKGILHGGISGAV